MTIASEIEKLSTNLTNSYDACETKGATLPTHQNFDNLSDTILSIPSGGGSDTYEADLVLKGVVDGLPQPTEEEVVNNTIPILKTIIYGYIASITQIVIPTLNKNSYMYSLLLHYDDNTMLPVIIDTINDTIIVMEKIEEDSTANCFVQNNKGEWVKAKGEDSAENITYVYDSKLISQMSYTRAEQINWDDGHKNGTTQIGTTYCSVTTYRYSLNNNVITDTYTGEIVKIY